MSAEDNDCSIAFDDLELQEIEDIDVHRSYKGDDGDARHPDVDVHVASTAVIAPKSKPRRKRRKLTPAESFERMWSKGIDPGKFFDAGMVEPGLQQLVDTGTLPNGRALVPGCGRGYAVAALASPDRVCTGLEISKTGCDVAKDFLKDVPNTEMVVGDFFEDFCELAKVGGGYSVIYDCTFFCILQPEQRPIWAKRMHHLLRVGGVLVVDIFPIASHTLGPPFALSEEMLRTVIEPLGFVCVTMTPLTGSLKSRPKTDAMEILGQWRKL
eukprot:m.26825 g.26825  ORF g.26825 m.26825 type:complete len:269 (+) comp15561_c0_seq1:86-892(+)